MHMHERFMKMHGEHMGPPHHRMFHGRHGMGHHMMHKPHGMGPHMPHKPGFKPHEMGRHIMHPHMFHRMHHEMHGKHCHRRSFSSSSSSSSSSSEDEFRAHGHGRAQNGCEPHWKPCHDMHKRHGKPHHIPRHLMMDHTPETGEVAPYMKPAHNRPFCMMHKKH